MTSLDTTSRPRTPGNGGSGVHAPKDAGPDGEWRVQVVERFATVRGFVRMVCEVIEFGATRGRGAGGQGDAGPAEADRRRRAAFRRL